MFGKVFIITCFCAIVTFVVFTQCGDSSTSATPTPSEWVGTWVSGVSTIERGTGTPMDTFQLVNLSLQSSGVYALKRFKQTHASNAGIPDSANEKGKYTVAGKTLTLVPDTCATYDNRDTHTMIPCTCDPQFTHILTNTISNGKWNNVVMVDWVNPDSVVYNLVKQ